MIGRTMHSTLTDGIPETSSTGSIFSATSPSLIVVAHVCTSVKKWGVRTDIAVLGARTENVLSQSSFELLAFGGWRKCVLSTIEPLEKVSLHKNIIKGGDERATIRLRELEFHGRFRKASEFEDNTSREPRCWFHRWWNRFVLCCRGTLFQLLTLDYCFFSISRSRQCWIEASSDVAPLFASCDPMQPVWYRNRQHHYSQNVLLHGQQTTSLRALDDRLL